MKLYSMCITQAFVSRFLSRHSSRPGKHVKAKFHSCSEWMVSRKLTFHGQCVRWATTTAAQSGSDGSTASAFRPKRVVVFTKMTRYEFERRRHSRLTEKEFKLHLESKDSRYEGLLQRHHNHLTLVEGIRKTLESANIETRIVQRFELNSEAIDWADAVFTAGGDGTYLLAASKFFNKDKPLIGLNTDPEKSEGHLLLPKRKYPASNFKAALKRILEGDFRWRYLQRIQVEMSGQHPNDDPIELHDQQLMFPEHRYLEHIAENEQERHPRPITGNTPPPRVLPVLALNEVFVGESLSSRVSYYEFSVDDGPREKQKSSGVTICTGTGSSSWHFHINNLPAESVHHILHIANQKMGSSFPVDDWPTMEAISNEFNSSLRFDPQSPSMAYTIRDPVINGVFQVSNRRSFAKKIRIRSRMWDACLVIDGGMSFKFNDGAVATFEIAEGNAIRTVEFD
ncbi:NAD kinase 2, mitochondrial-like [Babylonia areolata]|uniref:NAD kinase 2, mitochondrial-like n=1 Tax=Babylonia areolata TaxID=304850 RepID=UPI003FD14EE9